MNDDFSPQSGGGNTWLDHTHKAVLINIWLSADLTEHLLRKQMTNYDEVIEKLFSEATDLENFPQIQDPVVQVYLCVFVCVSLEMNKLDCYHSLWTVAFLLENK